MDYFLLANPISHVYCDLGRSSRRSVISLTGICTKCQLVTEVSPMLATKSLASLRALRRPSQSLVLHSLCDFGILSSGTGLFHVI